MANTIYHHGQDDYRLIQIKRGRWQLTVWCDCILGPHWHEMGTYPTKRFAAEAIDAVRD